MMARGREQGSATVWCLMLLGALSLSWIVTMAWGRAVAARHQAGSAADLAALAAADRVFDGTADPCRVATRIARAHGAILRKCEFLGDVVDVVVEARFPALLGALPPAQVRARAGPLVDERALSLASSWAR